MTTATTAAASSTPTDMFELMDLNAPIVQEEAIDMKKCALSATYKIFQKDPAGELKLLANDANVHLAWYPIYRVGEVIIYY